MKLVIKVEKGDFTLTHKWYVDDFGFKKNFFELVYRKPNGFLVNLPFTADIRVSNDMSFHDNISPYTRKEYYNMINRYGKHLK